MPVLKMKPTLNGEGSGGTTVVANPELEGTEPDLTGLEVEGVKYKVPQGGGADLGNQFQPNQKILEFFNKALQLDDNLNFKQTFFGVAKFKQALVDAGVDMSAQLFDGQGGNLCLELVIPNKSMTDQSGGDSYLEVYNEIYEFEFVEGTSTGAGNIYLKENIDFYDVEEPGLIIPKSELPDNPTLGDALDYLITNDIAIKSNYKDAQELTVVPYKVQDGLYNIPEFTTCMVYEGYGSSSQAFIASDGAFKGYALLDDLTDSIFAEE